jgi:class 3 adenylate cyclase
MVKFAADCRAKMNMLTIQLETTLGPGTAELKLRQGLHSGSVTAGVLRNDKSRFQLFGDTVCVEYTRGPLVCTIDKAHHFSLSLSCALA